MRVVGLEEHVLLPDIVDDVLGPEALDEELHLRGRKLAILSDVGEGRLNSLDANDVSVQVLSISPPGAERLEGNMGVEFAAKMNDRMSQVVQQHPRRFAAFAHLPMRTPMAAAYELERVVTDFGFRGAMINGTTDGKFLDDPHFAPVLAKAEQLDVPIYLHPNNPPKAVFDAYFGGLPPHIGNALAKAGYSWHGEVGLHVLRLALSGTMHRYPNLKFIVGHMGETLPFMLARAHDCFSRQDGIDFSLAELITDRVYVTTSGFFTMPPFINLLMTFGADRIMFSVDYPYRSNEQGRKFLDMLGELNIAPADLRKIAHGNADRLLKLQ